MNIKLNIYIIYIYIRLFIFIICEKLNISLVGNPTGLDVCIDLYFTKFSKIANLLKLIRKF